MKKYFTKYLPVKGEIKEGDKIYFKQDGKRGLMSEKGLPKWVIDKCKEKGHKTGRLFICSRDIKVGDKVYRERLEDWEVFDEEPTNTEHGSWGFLSEVKETDFKAIGEVSPEATWVTEGMEFDEDAIRPMYYSAPQGWVIGANNKIDTTKKYRVFIKGPCGHFH